MLEFNEYSVTIPENEETKPKAYLIDSKSGYKKKTAYPLVIKPKNIP